MSDQEHEGRCQYGAVRVLVMFVIRRFGAGPDRMGREIWRPACLTTLPVLRAIWNSSLICVRRVMPLPAITAK